MAFTVVYSDKKPVALLVQPVDSHDMEEMDNEVEYIRSHTQIPFRLIAVQIKKWNDELTPWQAPPVFGKIPFGNGAYKTLEGIKDILKYERSNGFLGHNKRVCQKDSAMEGIYAFDTPSLRREAILGGYSLAGLFSLWAGTQHPFDGIVAASPSVWYKDWLDYSAGHAMLTKHVYLSLGDKEHRSKTPIMATVNDCIHRQLDIVTKQGVDCVLEMNPGNHFQDNGVRTAKGFVWAMEHS